MMIAFHDGINTNVPLTENPLRDDVTKEMLSQNERSMTRLINDARNWRDANYRKIMSMKYNREKVQ